MRLKTVWVVIVFMLTINGGIAFAQSDNTPEILDEFTPNPSELTVTVTATGVVEPIRSVDINFEVSAPVSEIMVLEGDSVRQGDVLAQLESDDLIAALREAEIALQLQQLAYEALVEPPREVDLAVAEAAVVAAEAQILAAGFGPTAEQIEIARVQSELARNQLWQAQLNRDIVYDLPREFRGGSPTEIQLESAISQAEIGTSIADTNIEATIRSGGGLGAIASAEAQLVQSQVSLEKLLRGPDEIELLKFEIQLDQAELAVDRARVAIERATLKAPFSGVLSQNNLAVGEVPPLSQPAMQLLDNSSFFVDLAIDESDVVTVEMGQEVVLRLDALPEADIRGFITRISLVPDDNSNVVVYSARVSLSQITEPIRVGMSATATVTTRQLQDVLVLPNRFIRIDRDTQQAFVVIQRNEKFEEIPVVLGERNNDVSEVVSGLEFGQRVVQLPRDTLDLSEVLSGPG